MDFRATQGRNEQWSKEFAGERESGERLQRWIDDPSTHCPTSQTDLTIQDLKNWTITENVGGLPEGCSNERMRCLGLPMKGYRVLHLEKTFTDFLCRTITTEWLGRAARRVLFIEDVRRDKGALGPFISELSIAAYKRSFPLDSLQHVFVTYIKNKTTRPVLKSLCPKDEVVVLEHGTPEYQTLLGTPIGKLVAHLVLGAYERGTRHISRVTIWWTGPRQNRAQVQFDIETIHHKASILSRFLPNHVTGPRGSGRLRGDTALQTLSKAVVLSLICALVVLIDRHFRT